MNKIDLIKNSKALLEEIYALSFRMEDHKLFMSKELAAEEMRLLVHKYYELIANSYDCKVNEISFISKE